MRKWLCVVGLVLCGVVSWGQEVPDLKVDPGALKAWRVSRAGYQAQEVDVPGGRPGETWTRQRWVWTVTASTVKYYWPEYGYFELAPDQYSAVCVVGVKPVPWDKALTAGDTVTVRWRVVGEGLKDVPVAVTALVRKTSGGVLEVVAPFHSVKLSRLTAKQTLTLELPGGFSVALQESALRGVRGKLP